MEIYYINSKNEKLDLVRWPYRIQTADLFNYKRNYTYMETTSGGNISSFNTPVVEKSVQLTVAASTRKDYYDALNRFFRVVDADVSSMTPGKLYIDGQYMTCYIFGSEKTEWEYGCNSLDNTIAIVSGAPYWVTEHKKSYMMNSLTEESDFLDYPFDHPYDYMPSVFSNSMDNPGYESADFRMTIYGPILNPAVTIGQDVYRVYTELEEDEYLVIDSREKVVEQVSVDGVVVSKYNARDKDYDIYKKIPAGNSQMSWSGFGFDLTLYIERSEPEWIL